MIYHEFFLEAGYFCTKLSLTFYGTRQVLLGRISCMTVSSFFSVTDHMLWINCYGSTVCSLPLKVYSVPCTFSGGSIRNARFMAFSFDRT